MFNMINIEKFEEIKFEELEDEINKRIEHVNTWKKTLKNYEEDLKNSIDEEEIKQLNRNIGICKRAIKDLNKIYGFEY